MPQQAQPEQNQGGGQGGGGNNDHPAPEINNHPAGMVNPVPFIIPNLQPPGELDIDPSHPGLRERWTDWKEAFRRYLLLSGANTKELAFKSALFLQCIGADARKVAKGFVYVHLNADGIEVEENKDDAEILIKKYDEYFLNEKRDFIERLKFARCNQKENETFEQFLSNLRALAADCNFCSHACVNARILDRIVDGHRDDKVKEKLMRCSTLNYTTVVNICRSMAVSDENKKVVMKSEEVNKIYTASGSQRRSDRKCLFCDGYHRFVKSACPAWGKSCLACNEPNHFANSEACKKGIKGSHKSSNTPSSRQKYRQPTYRSKNKKVHALRENESSDEVSDTEGSVCVVSEVHAMSDKSKPILCQMLINGEEVVHQVDPGASVCILPAKYLPRHDNPVIRDEKVTLKMWNGSTMKAVGKCKLKIHNPKNGKNWKVDYVIVNESDYTPILSRNAAETMGLVTVNYNNFKVCALSINPVKEFSEVFDPTCLGSLPGGPVKLTLEPDAQPVVCPARTIPEALKQKVKDTLDKHVANGTMAVVDRPTDWVNQMAVVQKKSGEVRICIDPRPLNMKLKREHHKLPVLDDILPKLSGAKIFSTYDLKNGYHHLELDEESSHLTTFATPFGRYRWIRLPFGLNVSSEIFQKRLCQALEGLPNVQCVADDVIIHSKSEEEHDDHVRLFLTRCTQHGIKLNSDKCQFKVKEIQFLGHIITPDGLKPDPAKIEAIRNMSPPTEIPAVERLKGMVAYLARFIPNVTDVMRPIAKLTHQNVEWHWGKEQEESFIKIQQLLTQSPALAYYDANKELVIQCDASGEGIGAALLQEEKPLAYASRALTPAESRYAIIEKEMLAIVFALEKWHQYTYARPVIIHSDHRPLQSITKKPLDRAPKRLQSLLVRTLAYDVDVRYKKGKHMYLADTLSRAYLKDQPSDQEEIESVNAIEYIALKTDKIIRIRDATERDPALQTLKALIKQGWPPKEEVPTSITHYFSHRDELAVTDGLIFRGERLVIPRSLRQEMLHELHRGHTGVEGSLRRARETIYWPSMNGDVKNHSANCEVCREFDIQQAKEPLIPSNIPDRPFQKVATDLFTLDGKEYLVTVDYYSNFWEVDRLLDTHSTTVIQKLKTHFARYGIPDELVTDNGPQFTSSHFTAFTKKWEIDHITSSPHHPQGNGKAESAVKNAKRLIRKTSKANEDPYLAILAVRNTPQQGVESSPAQRLLGRRTKSLIPMTETSLTPDNAYLVKEKLKINQQRQKNIFDRHTKALNPLEEGDTVRMRPVRLKDASWRKATVLEKLDDRSYNVELPNGNVLRRNRVDLRATKEQPEVTDDSRSDLEDPSANQPSTPAPAASPPTPLNSQNPALDKSTVTPQKAPVSNNVRTRLGRTSRQPAYLSDYVTYKSD